MRPEKLETLFVALTVCLLSVVSSAAPPRSGVGKFVWPDGSSYVGEWLNSQPSGRGVFTNANGQRYEGSFAYGLPDGQGTYIWPNGRRYVGGFKQDKFHGEGTETWPSGERYEGAFDNGEITGIGRYSWPNGDRYEGNFFKGLRSGQGTFTWSNGDYYRGEWKSDERDGLGAEYSRDGAMKRSGRWASNKFVPVILIDTPTTQGDGADSRPAGRARSIVQICLDKGLKPGTEKFSACIAER